MRVRSYVAIMLCETVVLSAVMFFVVSTFHREYRQNVSAVQPQKRFTNSGSDDQSLVEFASREDMRASLLQHNEEQPPGGDYNY